VAALPTRRQVSVLLSAVGAAAFAPLGLAQAQDTPLELPDDPAADQPTRIATERNSFEQITAPVTINGQGPFPFLVDTGANASCLSEKVAERLSLPAGPAAAVRTAKARRVRQSVIINELQVGTRTRRKVTAPVLPITGMEVDGVLGVDWLKGQRLVLGLADRSLAVTASLREASAPGRVVVDARRKMGQLTIVDADMSGVRISAMIDTGSQVSLGNEPLRRLLRRGGPNLPGADRQIRLISIIGEVSVGDLAYIPFMRLGGIQLGNVPVVFTDMDIFALWKLDTAPAIILGMDILSEFTSVALDFGRSKVRFDVTGSPEAAA
jgi:predicted aspartyl protease